MIYETNLLDPMWWINNLIGSMTILIVLIELYILSFIRKIPNITTFAVILMGINAVVLIYAILQSEGVTLGQSVLGLMMVVFGFIAWSSYNDS